MADTTFSSLEILKILTPCVFLPALLISFTAHLITLPLSGYKITSSPVFTGSDATTLPFLEEFIIPIIPFPPLFVTL